MPGGQYTNLYEQARALGLADRWSEICKMYADVNQLLGDIVKVTPTSKAVGDMAILGKLMGMLDTFEIGFEIMPGTKDKNAPAAKKKGYEADEPSIKGAE
jgi:hypothetical protein